MKRSPMSTWVGGTVVLALLLLVAAWFLLISPVVTAAGETRQEAADLRATNEQTRLQVEVLKQQFETLDESKATLAELRLQVPTTAEISAYLRQVDAQATAHEVTLTSLTPSTPEVFSPAAAAGTSSSADEASSGTDASSATTTTTTTAPAGMVDIPVSMTVVGSYTNVMAWVQSIQQETDRVLLVTTVTGTGQDDAQAGGGRPATSVGDLEVTVAGYLYVLPGDDMEATDQGEASESTDDLPAADPNRNPLVPVG